MEIFNYYSRNIEKILEWMKWLKIASEKKAITKYKNYQSNSKSKRVHELYKKRFIQLYKLQIHRIDD